MQTYRFEVVTGAPFTATCIKCGKRVVAGGSFTKQGTNTVPFGTQSPVYADLNGKPFEAYYCEPCKQSVAA